MTVGRLFEQGLLDFPGPQFNTVDEQLLVLGLATFSIQDSYIDIYTWKTREFPCHLCYIQSQVRCSEPR